MHENLKIAAGPVAMEDLVERQLAAIVTRSTAHAASQFDSTRIRDAHLRAPWSFKSVAIFPASRTRGVLHDHAAAPAWAMRDHRRPTSSSCSNRAC